jgi:hypothetical protein
MTKPNEKAQSILDTLNVLIPRKEAGVNLNNDMLPDVSVDLGYRLAWKKVPCPIPAHVDKVDALLIPAHKIKRWNDDAEALVRKQYRNSQLMAKRDETCRKTMAPIVLVDFEKAQHPDLKRAAEEYREVNAKIKELQETLLGLIKKKEGKSKSLWKMCVETLKLDPVLNAYVYDATSYKLLQITPKCDSCSALSEIRSTKKEIEEKIKTLPQPEKEPKA